MTALGHDGTFAEIELAGTSLVDQHANGVTFETVKLKSVELSGSRLEHLTITHALRSPAATLPTCRVGARESRA